MRRRKKEEGCRRRKDKKRKNKRKNKDSRVKEEQEWQEEQEIRKRSQSCSWTKTVIKVLTDLLQCYLKRIVFHDQGQFYSRDAGLALYIYIYKFKQCLSKSSPSENKKGKPCNHLCGCRKFIWKTYFSWMIKGY